MHQDLSTYLRKKSLNLGLIITILMPGLLGLELIAENSLTVVRSQPVFLKTFEPFPFLNRQLSSDRFDC